MILGSVDTLSSENAAGWVYSSTLGDRLRVQAVLNGQILGEAIADVLRPDLVQAGLGTGQCGFQIAFDHEIDPLYLPFVEIRLEDSTLTLPRTGFAGLNDYFTAVYSRFPAVGRYASVLSGLWTDRSDASALLKSRVDVGIIALADSGALSRIIQEGLVVLEAGRSNEAANQHTPTPPIRLVTTPLGETSITPSEEVSKATARKDLTTAISEAFFNEDTLRILRTMLDDHPIAVLANSCVESDTEFEQISVMDDLPSPTECLMLIAPLASESIAVEALRGSHRFPEFRADGASRWTSRQVARGAATAAFSLVPADRFNIAPGQLAIISPGLLHRTIASAEAPAFRVLILSARLGFIRFRKRTPSGELSHQSGARIWVSDGD